MSAGVTNVAERIGELGVVPVAQVPDADTARLLAEALLEGGLPMVEITFRTDAAAGALASISDHYREMLCGAGTVLSTDQADAAAEAGARFVMAPGLNPAVVARCQQHDLPVFPGVCTPTEVEQAIALGLSIVKFFPSEPLGGLSLIRSFAGPYPHIRFIPTGGLDASNIRGYLRVPQVLACAGSWMVKTEYLDSNRKETIVNLVREAAAAVQEARHGEAR
jgi:2-dehydro-3-deoxyphosphogluconate aldolase/(4S)-4-hydroxy-2-oxoglutarate aldolase